MTHLALLTEDLSAVAMNRPGMDEIIAVYPELQIGSVVHDDSLSDWPRVVLVHDTPEPATAWGELAIETVPVNDAGTWWQAWTIESITLAQAKQQLGQMVISIYWSRMLAPPPVAEFQAAGMSFIPVMQARQTRWNDDVADVAARIQAATTIAQAHAIYQELEALA